MISSRATVGNTDCTATSGPEQWDQRCAGDGGRQHLAGRRSASAHGGAMISLRRYQLPCDPGEDAALKQEVVKRAGGDRLGE